MKIRYSVFFTVALVFLGMIAGCSSPDVAITPSTQDFGGGANMSTNIISPRIGQVFPAGRDIPLEAVASDVSGVGQVAFLVNNQQIAISSKPPYSAVLSQPAPGKYAIQSYATNKYGDNKLSSLVTITVK